MLPFKMVIYNVLIIKVIGIDIILKRKVADLGPITATEFAEKVETVQQQRTDKSNDEDQRTSLTCKDCGKAFTSENGLLNHMKSRKHLETVAKNANPDVSDWEFFSNESISCSFFLVEKDTTVSGDTQNSPY